MIDPSETNIRPQKPIVRRRCVLLLGGAADGTRRCGHLIFIYPDRRRVRSRRPRAGSVDPMMDPTTPSWYDEFTTGDSRRIRRPGGKPVAGAGSGAGSTTITRGNSSTVEPNSASPRCMDAGPSPGCAFDLSRRRPAGGRAVVEDRNVGGVTGRRGSGTAGVAAPVMSAVVGAIARPPGELEAHQRRRTGGLNGR